MLRSLFRGVATFVMKEYTNISSYIEYYGEKVDERYVIEYTRDNNIYHMDLKKYNEVYLKVISSIQNEEYFPMVEVKIFPNNIIHYVESRINATNNKDISIVANYKTDNLSDIQDIIKLFVNNHILCDYIMTGKKSTSNTW